MSFSSFWSDVIATVVGGVVLAIFFFLAKEKLFPLPKLTGRWHLEQTTENSIYAPYEGMILRYVVMLWQSGNCVEGTAEKIYEKSSNGERQFVGVHRTRAEVSGYIEKNYFGKDRIYLHVIEVGHGRESTNFYDLGINADEVMIGTFTSMVADQDGTCKLQSTPF